MHPIKVGPRDLVLLAGLPGAGKTTLLAGVRDTSAVTVRDSDQVRATLGARLPSWLPYRAYRPLVHAGHHLRVLVAVLRAPGPVLVHDPATRTCTRTMLARAARGVRVAGCAAATGAGRPAGQGTSDPATFLRPARRPRRCAALRAARRCRPTGMAMCRTAGPGGHPLRAADRGADVRGRRRCGRTSLVVTTIVYDLRIRHVWGDQSQCASPS